MRCRNKTAPHVSSCRGCARAHGMCGSQWDCVPCTHECARACVYKVSLQLVCTRTFVGRHGEDLSMCFCEF